MKGCTSSRVLRVGRIQSSSAAKGPRVPGEHGIKGTPSSDPHSTEIPRHLGLHEAEHRQPTEIPPLCSAAGSPTRSTRLPAAGHAHTAAGPAKHHKDDEGTGASDMQREAERPVISLGRKRLTGGSQNMQVT